MSNSSLKSLFYPLFAASLFSILCFLIGCGQQVSLIEKANRHYDTREYAVAANLYIEVYKNNKSTQAEKLTASIHIAQCYYFNHDYNNSLKWYSTAIERGAKDPIFYYKLAECLKMNGKYVEAILKFQEYQKMQPDDPNTAIMIEGCELGLKN